MWEEYKPTILDRLKWNSKAPSPEIKNEATRKPKCVILNRTSVGYVVLHPAILVPSQRVFLSNSNSSSPWYLLPGVNKQYLPDECSHLTVKWTPHPPLDVCYCYPTTSPPPHPSRWVCGAVGPKIVPSSCEWSWWWNSPWSISSPSNLLLLS